MIINKQKTRFMVINGIFDTREVISLLLFDRIFQ